MCPRCLLQSYIGNFSSDIEKSSSHPHNIRDYTMGVNNSDRFSHDLALDEIPGFIICGPLATPGTSSEIIGLSMDELRRAYTARLSEMEHDIKEVKEQLERSIVMSYGNKKHKSGHENGRRIRVGG